MRPAGGDEYRMNRKERRVQATLGALAVLVVIGLLVVATFNIAFG